MILISNQEKGYFITATINHGSYIPEALHVERIDDMALYDGDFEAAKAAEQDGVRLIYGMDGIPDGIYIYPCPQWHQKGGGHYVNLERNPEQIRE